MTEPDPTPEALDEIRRALEKATPGPWILFHGAGKTIAVRCAEHVDVVGWPGFDDAHRAEAVHAANAALIVLLRNNAEALLAAIETARREREEAEGIVANYRRLAHDDRRIDRALFDVLRKQRSNAPLSPSAIERLALLLACWDEQNMTIAGLRERAESAERELAAAMRVVDAARRVQRVWITLEMAGDFAEPTLAAEALDAALLAMDTGKEENA